MNLDYLNTLPETANEYNAALQEAEKVIFAAKLSTFGDDRDQILCAYDTPARLTLTNQRILVNTDAAVWTVDLAEDLSDCQKIQSRFLWKKMVYFNITLQTEMSYDNGKRSLKGFHLYFKEQDTPKFEEIMDHLLH